MSGEIYIDVVFGANLLMDYILLRVLGMALGLRRRPGRCLAAALVGALFSCLVLWFPKEAFPAAVILHGLCAAGMIRIGFGVKKGALLLNTVFMLDAAAFSGADFVKPWRTERALCGLFSSAPSAYTQGRGLPSVWETLSGSEEKIYIRLLCPGMEKNRTYTDSTIPGICLPIL